ncbi:hypothetical protein [Pontibacter akesuensis]|uniref:Uncharacterized protein n=1 Tax=Pontibacter akesuensis TaxID=388950 RepID=A0A1I7I4D9_9BACT|nr:hypothetical protein [Pontibacter akesuensis]GHA65157.1 hypothetical protein GCM10007389_17430 [Pontibacter akesuensis]SFU67772.1 hypothetical protein SAMN04487941_1904 [Pontibacter akesuensis]
MAKYTSFLLAGLLLVTAACERPAPPASDKADTYFDLTAYLQEQKRELQANQPMVLKAVATQGQAPEIKETTAIDWEDELTVFEQVDLNRPSLQEYYTKQEQVLEDGSVAVEYTKLPDAEAQVAYLRLRLSPEGRLLQLNARLQDENIIFFSNRSVQLDANAQTGDISSYKVEGVQKMVFGDSLRYMVETNL